MGQAKFSTPPPALLPSPTELPNSYLNHEPQIGSLQPRFVHKHALSALHVIKFDKIPDDILLSLGLDFAFY